MTSQWRLVYVEEEPAAWLAIRPIGTSKIIVRNVDKDVLLADLQRLNVSYIDDMPAYKAEPIASSMPITTSSEHGFVVDKPVLTKKEQVARAKPTGDACQDCGGFTLVRTGTCMTCQNCGSTSGGCS